MQWEIVIGLEVHTQLSTRSKIFSGASTAFGAEPNTQADGNHFNKARMLNVAHQYQQTTDWHNRAPNV